ncbi:MAG: glycerol-3-phosphate acyltransferase [Chloroflexota bacterium]
MTIEFILLCIGAYLLGSVPFAFLLAKWFYGIDIRRYGTGKIGAANVLRVASKWLAIPVAIFDIGKGALMVWAAQLLGMGAAAQVTVGLITIVGHNWPVFLRFRGGRGIFTSLGVITMLSPWLGLIILIIPYLFAPIRQVAFGVFLALVSLPFFSWFLSQPLAIDERLPVTLGLVVLSLMAFFKRLVTPRTELSKSVPMAELIFNRILFDRDIRDASAWTQRKSGK